MPRVNVQGLEDSSPEIFELRPDGNYNGVVTGAKLRTTGENSKHPGSPMLELAIKLDPTDEMPAMTLKSYYILPDEGYMEAEEFGRRTREQKRICVATGVAIDDDGYDTDDMLDQPVVVVVGSETQETGEYAGRTSNKIKDILPV